MKVASHQPAFLPWPGFWHKVASVDRFVLSCHVKWSKDGFLNRAKHAGSWLTAPVTVSDSMFIDQAKLAPDLRGLRKAAKTIAQIRGPKHHRLGAIVACLDQAEPGECLWALNANLIGTIGGLLGLCTKFVVNTDEQDGGSTGESLHSRLLSSAEDMSSYYAGSGALNYLHPQSFGQIPIFIQDASGFSPDVSIVQLIASEPDPLDWIMSRGKWRPF